MTDTRRFLPIVLAAAWAVIPACKRARPATDVPPSVKPPASASIVAAPAASTAKPIDASDAVRGAQRPQPEPPAPPCLSSPEGREPRFPTRVMLIWLAVREPEVAAAMNQGTWGDLGNLLLAFAMLWAYMSFSQLLLPGNRTRAQIVVTFMAVLELLRDGRISAWQRGAHGEIVLATASPASQAASHS